jgi:hypothetical protein
MEAVEKQPKAPGPGIWTCARCWLSRRHFWGSAPCRFPNGAPPTTPGTSIVIADPAEPMGEWWPIWGCRRAPSCG